MKKTDKARPQIEDIPEPNLFRETFPIGQLPNILLDDHTIPMSQAKSIWVTDTTFRDGQQARPPYSIEQIVDIYKLLAKLDGGAGIIRQSEFFLYSKKDRQAVEACLEVGAAWPRVTGWIRAVKSDFKLVKQMGLTETGILTSCSDYHIFLKLAKTRKQAMQQYLEVVMAAMEEGIVPRCHLEDITRADFHGFVLPFACELMDLRAKYGIDVRIRACDTLGYGLPWAQAALPRSVPKIIHGLIHEAGVPGELLEWHGHNDFHKVLSNPVAAWLYGCSSANASLFGIGERTGNAPLEAMVIEAAQLGRRSPKINYPVITEIADYFANKIGYQIPTSYPLVGRDFNTTRAGIHSDGLMKNQEIYSAFDTMKFLNRPAEVAITDKSGAAGIKHWIDLHYGLAVAKDDARLMSIHQKVETEYETGRTTAISDDEMHAWYHEAFGT